MCVCVCVCEAGSAVLTSQLCRSVQVGGEEQGGGHDEAGQEPARLLVKEGLVTAIENIKLEDVELTLEQTEVLMSVARRVVVLENVKLPPAETEAVFRSLARLSCGLLLMDGVDIDTAAATAGLAKISGDLSRISPGLGKGSKLKKK